jgi:hypothetical protein
VKFLLSVHGAEKGIAAEDFDGKRGRWYALCAARALAAVGVRAIVGDRDGPYLFMQSDSYDMGEICTVCHPGLCTDPAEHFDEGRIMSRDRYDAMNGPARKPLNTRYIVLRGGAGQTLHDPLEGRWYDRQDLLEFSWIDEAMTCALGVFLATGRVERRSHDSELAEVYELDPDRTDVR